MDSLAQEVAPSPKLRTWFGHDRAKWEEFKRRYWNELEKKPEPVNLLKGKSREGPCEYRRLYQGVGPIPPLLDKEGKMNIS
jgi:uncharacterized protein YeaO (DUF488 family)